MGYQFLSPHRAVKTDVLTNETVHGTPEEGEVAAESQEGGCRGLGRAWGEGPRMTHADKARASAQSDCSGGVPWGFPPPRDTV